MIGCIQASPERAEGQEVRRPRQRAPQEVPEVPGASRYTTAVERPSGADPAQGRVIVREAEASRGRIGVGNRVIPGERPALVVQESARRASAGPL